MRRDLSCHGARTPCPGGAGHLCAAGQPPGRVAAQMGARGPRLPLSRAGGVPPGRRRAERTPRRPRALHRAGVRGAAARCCRRPASAPRSTDGRSTSTASTARCSASSSISRSCSTCARCASWWTRYRECYAALGVVHGRWPYIPGEFDDYIATPKGNGYRSIHTAVIGPQARSVEVQIRTREMHEHAELGVAAHWTYKEGGPRDAQYQRKIEWVRRLLEPRRGRRRRCRPRSHRGHARRAVRGPGVRAHAQGRGDRSGRAGRPRSILPTRCTPPSVTAVAAPRSTGASCRSPTRW